MSLATNASGAKILNSDTRYYPYGEARPGLTGTALPTDRRYTGQRQEIGLGLYDYNARYYDPYLNRFISPDSIIPDPANPQSLNRYAYCLNNPLRYVDYSGHTPWDVIDAIFWVLSANDFVRDPTWGNAFWLALDTVSLAPILPSLGYITRGSKLASKYDDIAKFVVKYGDEAM